MPKDIRHHVATDSTIFPKEGVCCVKLKPHTATTFGIVKCPSVSLKQDIGGRRKKHATYSVHITNMSTLDYPHRDPLATYRQVYILQSGILFYCRPVISPHD